MISLNSSDNFGISNYIVDSTPGDGSYTTIQEAINAANATGLTVNIYIRPGTYIEDLTLFDKINLTSCGGNSRLSPVTILGSHTPPLSGSIGMSNLNLVSESASVFESVGVGSCSITLDFCMISTNNFIFDLTNWSGLLDMEYCIFSSPNMSLVNNLGGSSIFIIGCNTLNPGVSPAMVTSSITGIINSMLGVPIQLTGNAFLYMVNSTNRGVVTFNDLSSGFIIDSLLISSGNNCINSLSTSGSNTQIQSSILITDFPTVIDGSGGTMPFSLQNVIFDGTQLVVPGTILQFQGFTENNILLSNNISFDRGSTLLDTDGQLIIGSTSSNPSISTITAGSGINVTNGPGSITLSTTSTSVSTWNVQTSNTALVPGNGYVTFFPSEVLLFSLPTTSLVGDIIELANFDGAGWVLEQSTVSQQIRLGTSITTLGLGGSISSSTSGDTVRLVCVQDNNLWQALSVIGTLTIV